MTSVYFSLLLALGVWTRTCDPFTPPRTLSHQVTEQTPLFVASSEVADSLGSSSEGASANDLPMTMTTLPRHSNRDVNVVLEKTEALIQSLHVCSNSIIDLQNDAALDSSEPQIVEDESIYANSYVDMAKVDVLGFDYDYTLVTYTDELLELIYAMALSRLVKDQQYPAEMLDAGLQFDPFFSIRGLAVDRETGWICHLSYTHKVAVAWDGREKLPTNRIYEEYRGKRALRPSERRKRLKPLNDLFSMAECCLIADTIQFFKDNNIPYCPMNLVTDVLSVIGATHISGDFHRLVAENPEIYFKPSPHLEELVTKLKSAGKGLIFASNSPFWYVDAGMKYFMGENWKDSWDVVITTAGKPRFYTETSRPFREVCQESGRLQFKKVDKFEKGAVYTAGCLNELIRILSNSNEVGTGEFSPEISGATSLSTSNVLYIGDSLFADLVDAKREFGWTTAAVTPEVGYEQMMESKAEFIQTRRSIDLLLNALRLVQDEMGTSTRSEEDMNVLDSLERKVSKWRDREQMLLGNPFGSVFRSRHQPSLFAHSLRRYCDLYMSSVANLRHYSPQHRFYPEQGARLLAHEIRGADLDCWDLEEVISNGSD